MSFACPLAWLLLLTLPLLFWRPGKAQSTARHPLVSLIKPRASWRMLAYRGLPFISGLGLIALIAALAGPRISEAALDPPRSGIAIMMTLDRSGSMGASLETADGITTRLDIVKKVFADFANQRKNDLIGLIAFARYPETLAPLSGSVDTLTGFLDVLDVPQSREEDGTSIGDAVALATVRLQAAGPQIKSRVLILLTDGLNNAGAVSPLDAAKQAAAAGVRLYAIGFGGKAFQILADGVTRVPLEDSFDADLLTQMATLTGGQFFAADSTGSLKAVYAKIDQLEKSAVSVPPQQRYTELYWIFGLIGLGLLLLERLLALTLLPRMER